MALTLDELREMGVTYFASGSNAAGEILGLHDADVDVGVAVQELNEDALYALTSLAGTGRKVFVDSGAFSEVAFGARGPSWPHPISDAEWGQRLDVYQLLAEALGDQVYLVAPDRVADQQGTFVRQAEWAPVVRELHALGANILVPLQKGALSLHEAQLVSQRVLELTDIIPAIPMKKDATRLDELEEYLRAAKPKRVHLLGLGAKADDIEQALEAVTRASPKTRVFLDSVLIRSMVGRQGGVRRYTAAQDVERSELDPFGSGEGADYTDLISDPSAWLEGTNRKWAVAELGLGRTEGKAFMADPTAWYDAADEGQRQIADPVLDAAWKRYWDKERKSDTVKRRGAVRALADVAVEPHEAEDRYAFELAATSPTKDWRAELRELATVLRDDPEWPYGRYLVSLNDVPRTVHALDALKLWRRGAEVEEGIPSWRTMQTRHQDDVDVELVLEGRAEERAQEDGDSVVWMVLTLRPTYTRGGKEIDVEPQPATKAGKKRTKPSAAAAGPVPNAKLPSLKKYDWIVVSTSGGKDSQAMLWAVCERAKAEGVLGRVVAVHALLGELVWEGDAELAAEQARLCGVRHEEVSRIGTTSSGAVRATNVVPLYREGEKRGDLLDQVEHRWRQLQARAKAGDAKAAEVPPWFSISNRFCTADFKRGPIEGMFTRLAEEWRATVGEKRPCRILDCEGMRAQESRARSKLVQFEPRKSNSNVHIDTVLPIHHWLEEHVWETIEASRLPYHWCYDLGAEEGQSLRQRKAAGMPRLSCVFCCFAPKAALALAATYPGNAPLLERYIKLEKKTGFTFKPDHTMTDVRKLADSGVPLRKAHESWEM